MAARKGFQQCCISCIALFFFVSFAVAAAPTPPKPTITSVKTGKKDLTEATDVKIIKENLTSSGEILIIGQADGHGSRVARVEVSLDGGTTWKQATGKEQWQYRFTPLPNDTYNLILRVTNAAGVVSDSKTSRKIRLTYLPITLWELIQQRVDGLAKTYMSRDLEGYMGFISSDYQNYPRGRHRLRRTIDNDFKSLNNIVLRFVVDQVFEIEGVIMAEMYWRLTYAGLATPEEGYAEIHFDSTDQLKIVLQEKDRYFGAASRRAP